MVQRCYERHGIKDGVVITTIHRGEKGLYGNITCTYDRCGATILTRPQRQEGYFASAWETRLINRHLERHPELAAYRKKANKIKLMSMQGLTD